jgi:hypothetical protein
MVFDTNFESIIGGGSQNFSENGEMKTYDDNIFGPGEN